MKPYKSKFSEGFYDRGVPVNDIINLTENKSSAFKNLTHLLSIVSDFEKQNNEQFFYLIDEVSTTFTVLIRTPISLGEPLMQYLTRNSNRKFITITPMYSEGVIKIQSDV